MIANSIKQELRRIKKEIEKEQVSYSEIFFLECHKAEIMKMDDILLAQWAGITEEEWNNKKLIAQ